MDTITNKPGLLRWFLCLLWTAGLTGGSDVVQTSKLWEVEGVDATMNCTHTKGAGFFQMYWYRQLPGETMKQIVYTSSSSADHDFGHFSKDKFSATKPDAASGTLTVKKLQQGDKGWYFCAVSDGVHYDPAYFGGGTRLTVLEPGRAVTKPTVRVLRPSPKECGKFKGRGKSKTIVCVASGFYPDHVGVQWTVDGLNISDGVATDDAARQEGKNYHITSRLRVSAKNFTEDRKFTCTVSFFNGKHTEYVSDFIHGEPAGGSAMTRDKYLMVTQTARFSYGYLIAKSGVFGVLVALLVWKLQRSAGKQND